MIARNVSLETLQRAAKVIHAELFNCNPVGKGFRFVLRPINGCQQRRISASGFSYSEKLGRNRRVHAICWHGHRDFFREVFKETPTAKFLTAVDTWNGTEDFEARFRESGWRIIGSQAYPINHAEACDCPESGEV